MRRNLPRLALLALPLAGLSCNGGRQSTDDGSQHRSLVAADLLEKLSSTIANLACDPQTARFTLDGPNLSDASCNAYPATAEGSPVLDAAGRVGSAVVFDGSGARVEAGNILDFSADDAFSVSAWIDLGCDSGNGVIASKSASDGDKRGWMFRLDGQNRLKLVLKHERTTDRLSVISSMPVAADLRGGWHMVSATYDGSRTGAGIKLYVDGDAVPVTVEDEGLSGEIQTGPSVPFVIGAKENGDQAFDGGIDEVVVRAGVWTAAEIDELYTSVESMPLDGASRARTVARWRLNSLNAGVVIDEIGNAEGAGPEAPSSLGSKGRRSPWTAPPMSRWGTCSGARRRSRSV